MKATLAQLLAAAQLAEMVYNADQVEHKREAWEKAVATYNEAAEAEQTASLALAHTSQLGKPIKDLDTLLKDSGPYKELEKHATTLAGTVDALLTKNDTLDAENNQVKQERLQLIEENTRLKESNSLLNSQLIEKGHKIGELEKSALSAKPATPATAETSVPGATPENTPAATDETLTPYQKGLQTRAANLAAKAAEGDPKKNS